MILCVHVSSRGILQAVGDEIVEVDGFSVSEKTLLTHILGTDTPDTFVSIMVPSVPLLQCVGWTVISLIRFRLRVRTSPGLRKLTHV